MVTRLHIPRRLLVPVLALLSGAVIAGADRPQRVQDLHYGEVLFHFYQDDYFTAISHLMAAQKQSLLPHHRDEAELLLGGLQLSYGMLAPAERRFTRLLGEDTSPELRNRAWLYLARIAYQRGLHDKALEALQRVDKPDAPDNRAQLAVLGANIYMAMGRDGEAAAWLEQHKAGGDMAAYLRINKGIAQLRAGDIEAGRKTLDALGQARVDSEELRALRDRANLALGYRLLRAGEPEQAHAYLGRVRLRGPFMQEALLGAGWADAERGNFEAALTPWLKLLELDSRQPAAQEARLAVPYSFARLGDRERALYFYEQAIAYYDSEQQKLDRAIADIASGSLLDLLGQADSLESGGWLKQLPALDDIPSGAYLVDVLSQHAFQENLKDYRDLGFLQAFLKRRLADTALFEDMVDARREAYGARAPQVREYLDEDRATALRARWQALKDTLAAQDRHPDPLALASGRELAQLARLDKVEATLAAIPDNHPRKAALRDKARWLRGVLYWQVQDDYPQRLWALRKQISEVEPLLAGIDAHRARLEQALEDVPRGFAGYRQRIDALRARIRSLLPAIHQAREQASRQIHRLAMAELEARRQRLVSYRAQARYALARSYDQLAASPAAEARP